jgi:hypothetical protein
MMPFFDGAEGSLDRMAQLDKFGLVVFAADPS